MNILTVTVIIVQLIIIIILGSQSQAKHVARSKGSIQEPEEFLQTGKRLWLFSRSLTVDNSHTLIL